MHTQGMDVKDRRVAQGDATKANLVAAARELFGEHGYADTSIEEVVVRAGLTKGAVYHHFDGKEGLFRAVFEQVYREVTDQAAAQFLGPDSWEALLAGCALMDRRPPRSGRSAHRPAGRAGGPRLGRGTHH